MPLHILHVQAPGRLPTVVADPGPWWSSLARSPRYSLRRSEAPARLWELACDVGAITSYLDSLPGARRALGRLSRALTRRDDPRDTAAAAREALEALRRWDTYGDEGRYVSAVEALQAHVDALQALPGTHALSITGGWSERGVDYARSDELVAASGRPGLLASLCARIIAEESAPVDLALLAAGSPQELLAALCLARGLRAAHPGAHVVLVDHGWENFSLSPHLDALAASGALTRAFDAIVAKKDERDDVVLRLAASVAAGARPRGLLTVDALPVQPLAARAGAVVAPPPTRAFCPEPVLWTRLSARRCYWSRCTFCVQNEKYDSERAPSRDELPGALDRLAAAQAAGYRNVILSDEAISPAMLSRLCEGIEARGIELRWACRCKLELAHTRALFARMRRAGCYEVLYGIESTSERVLARMDKQTPGLDAARAAEALGWMAAEGIGVHVNLMASFPGDALDDVEETVGWTDAALRGHRHATWLLNRFALFPGTPLARDPGRWGLALAPSSADMPMALGYQTLDPAQRAEEAAIDRALPALRRALLVGRGWSRWDDGAARREALSLYMGSGIGAALKGADLDLLSSWEPGAAEAAA